MQELGAGRFLERAAGETAQRGDVRAPSVSRRGMGGETGS